MLTQPQCAPAHVCLVCLMLFCCTVKYTSARVDDVVGSVSHLCIYLQHNIMQPVNTQVLYIDVCL